VSAALPYLECNEMNTATLVLQVNSDGLVKAKERQLALVESSQKVEAASEKLAAKAERAAEREYQAYLKAEQKGIEARQRETAQTEREYQKRQAAYERMWLSAEQTRARAEAKELAASMKRVKTEARVAEAVTAANAAKLASVQRELMTEEQLIRASEAKRRAVILESTAVTEAQRSELMRLSAAKTNAQLAALPSVRGAGGLAGALGPMAGMVGGLAGAAGFTMAAREVLNVTREFDKLNASLVTVTGSQHAANYAFEALQDLALKTPFTLRSATDMFVQLRNMGLDPSVRAMTAYGDMAAAFGTNLDHMMLAIGDATVGIMRPLKQYGIIAHQEGDKVKFSFRGVTTEVARDAVEIEKYLLRLAENNFAGAMANRMKTLDGAISNLADAWDKFALSFARSGAEDDMRKFVESVSTWMGHAAAAIAQHGKTAWEAWKWTAKIAGFIPNPTKLLSFGAKKSAEAIQEADLWGTGAAQSYQEKAQQQEKEATDALAKFRRDNAVRWAEQTAKDMAEIDKYLGGKEKKIGDEANELIAKAEKRIEDDQERRVVVNRIIEKAQNELLEKGEWPDKKKKKHGEYDPGIAEPESGFDRYREMKRREVDAVRESVARKEDSAREFYEYNKAVLEASNRDETEALRQNELIWAAHLAKIAEDKRKANEHALREEASYRKRLWEFGKVPSELEMINRKFAGQREDLNELVRRRMEGDRSNPFETPDQLQVQRDLAARSVEIERERIREISALQMQYTQNAITSSEAMFGSLATAAKNWKGETSREYAALFAIQKGFAVASAGLNMAKALSEASAASPWYAKIPAMASAMADAARIVAMISSANYSGAMDAGGDIPYGSMALVGERRPELVTRPSLVAGPAHITSGAETARMMSGGGAAPVVNVRVMPVATDMNRYRSSSRSEHVIGMTIQKHPELLRIGG
jgi:hypothetical protein